MKSRDPHLKLEETKASACQCFLLGYYRQSDSANAIGVQAGAIFINKFVQGHVQSLFRQAGFRPDVVETMTIETVNDFEQSAKGQFTGSEDEVLIQTGNAVASSPKIQLFRGMLSISTYVYLSDRDLCRLLNSDKVRL